ncbi:MAG: hypothetical protein WC583_00985 [Candidatus Omnitrophota bacterium]|jgi:hypothetical protein|nr:hypothetical protein [Candidatus Omnitrophota bacterium]MDD5526491.1 hypothetical protein [Candidatus Omnitrophota bacterium]
MAKIERENGNKTRRRTVLLCAVMLVLLLYASSGILTRRAVESGFSLFLPSAVSSFKECRVNPFGYIRLKGLLLDVPGKYVFFADAVSLEFSPVSLFCGRPRRVYLENPLLLLACNASGGNGISGGLKLPRFMPERLDIRNAEIRNGPNCPAFGIKGSLSAGFSGTSLTDLSAGVDTLRAGQFFASGISVYLPGENKEGQITMREFAFRDLRLEKVKGKVWVDEKGAAQALFSPVALWSGSLTAAADLYVSADGGIKYKCRFQVKNSDLEVVSRELGFSEKVALGGITSGEAVLEGGGSGLQDVSASLGTQSGGSMNIRDKKILDYLAVQSGRPLQTIYDSLRDYRYRSAILNLSTVEQELRIYAVFEGGQGKRVFDVRLHGMIGGRGI